MEVYGKHDEGRGRSWFVKSVPPMAMRILTSCHSLPAPVSLPSFVERHTGTARRRRATGPLHVKSERLLLRKMKSISSFAVRSTPIQYSVLLARLAAVFALLLYWVYSGKTSYMIYSTPLWMPTSGSADMAAENLRQRHLTAAVEKRGGKLLRWLNLQRSSCSFDILGMVV